MARAVSIVRPLRAARPEIDIWRAAQRYADKAEAESIDPPASSRPPGYNEGAPSWHLINFAKVPILQKPAVRDRFLSFTNT